MKYKDRELEILQTLLNRFNRCEIMNHSGVSSNFLYPRSRVLTLPKKMPTGHNPFSEENQKLFMELKAFTKIVRTVDKLEKVIPALKTLAQYFRVVDIARMTDISIPTISRMHSLYDIKTHKSKFTKNPQDFRKECQVISSVIELNKDTSPSRCKVGTKKKPLKGKPNIDQLLLIHGGLYFWKNPNHGLAVV